MSLPDGLPPILEEASTMVEKPLQAAVQRLADPLQRVVGYHMGWNDESGAPVARRGSKGIRPGFAFASARAAGAKPEIALPGAIAVELLNNFSFLHDDVMDGDRQRRHRETAWVVFGVAMAICAGDALLILAEEVILDLPASPVRDRALRRVSSTAGQMIHGQGIDLSTHATACISVEDWLQMNANKTGALLSCATSIGAVLADGPTALIDALSSFGLYLGLAFQAIDDYLGVFGSPEETGGRPSGFDVRAGKPALPTVIALTDGGPEARALKNLLSSEEMDDEQVREAIRTIELVGGRSGTIAEANRLFREATSQLRASGLEDAVLAEFLAIAEVGLSLDPPKNDLVEHRVR